MYCTFVTGNRATAKVVFRQPGFNFGLILDLLHDEDLEVQTEAGAALAAFSYNIASNQRLIARQAGGRLTFKHFNNILKQGDELQRSKASFQARLDALSFGQITGPFLGFVRSEKGATQPFISPRSVQMRTRFGWEGKGGWINAWVCG